MIKELIDKEYDVVIVGAGPGGSICGRECAKYGLKTLVVDKRQEIGAPVRCGEGLGEYWMKIAGLKPDKSWCSKPLTGVVLWSPLGKKYMIKLKDKGYVIERKVFEKNLAMDAIRKGAKYLMKARVYDVIKENGFVRGVRIESADGKTEIRAKIVIAADGVESKTAKYAGIDTTLPPHEIDSGYEYEMIGLNFSDTDKIHLYFGNKIAQRGYVWIFPKGKDRANVGIGIGGFVEKSAKYYLDKFIESHPEIFSKAGVVEVKGGGIPVGAPFKKPYANGLMIIGDAARMVSAIHGGGMGFAMEAGIIAAKTAKKAVQKKDFSENFLKKFADEWYKKRGNKLLEVLKARKFAEKLTDEDMEKLGEIIGGKPEQLLLLSSGKKFNLFLDVLRKSPRLAFLALTCLR